jgi:oligopeptide/dipeptide ABC transporter ATP-binding protein
MTALLSIGGLVTEFATDGGLLRAVDGVDLDVFAGECLGVVGESGSGKSVTFLSALGLVRPPGRVRAGRIVFDGRDLDTADPGAMRALRGREIAITLQDALTALNPALSVSEQIAEVLVAHGEAGSLRAARARTVELMRLVGIPAAERRMRDYPHQFSGGMRQRSMLAIALACRPRLLIADEPTTALDVTVQAQVLDLLDELRAKLGMAMVLITHDLGIVATRCDRVLVMYAGQIVESGPVRDLIADPQHPYTQALLASRPDLDRIDVKVRPIAGQVPDLRDAQIGCRFRPRCGLAEARCAAPIALTARGARSVRCVRAGG